MTICRDNVICWYGRVRMLCAANGIPIDGVNYPENNDESI